MEDIKKELKKFQEFKKNYIFKQNEIEEINGKQYCEGEPLVNEEGETIGDCEKWINVGYKNKGPYAKVLSNLFPYEFDFRGKTLKSIESFFQGIKFKDINMQNLVFTYSGLDANRVKACNNYDWKGTGILYFQGKEVNRYSKDYDDLIDELYISAIQNPLYRNVLKTTTRNILHTMGGQTKEETVFTRYEFELELNCLKDFLK